MHLQLTPRVMLMIGLPLQRQAEAVSVRVVTIAGVRRQQQQLPAAGAVQAGKPRCPMLIFGLMMTSCWLVAGVTEQHRVAQKAEADS